MLTTTKWLMAVTLVAALALAGGLGSSTFAQQQSDPGAQDRAAVQPGADAPADNPDVQPETFHGRIVDVRAYLIGAESSEADAGLERKELWSNGDTEHPIALVSERGFLGQMLAGKRVHLIIFDSQQPEAKEAYEKARTLIDQHVQLTGKVYDRDGLRAVSVQSVEIAAPETDDSQHQPSRESQQDDRTY